LKTGDGDRILATATAAGIDAARVEQDVVVLERVAELTAIAPKMPAVERVLADAQKRAEAAASEWDNIVPKLQQACDNAALDVNAADVELQSIKVAVAQAHVSYRDNPELLPAVKAPAAIKAVFTQENAQATEQAAYLAKMQRTTAAEKKLAELKFAERDVSDGRFPREAWFSPEEFEKDRPGLLVKSQTAITLVETEL
jgi:hypothetical protein